MDKQKELFENWVDTPDNVDKLEALNLEYKGLCQEAILLEQLNKQVPNRADANRANKYQKKEPEELIKIHTELQERCRTVRVSIKMVKKILAVLLKSDCTSKTLQIKTGYKGGTVRSAVPALLSIEVIENKNGELSIMPKYKAILSNCLIDK
jgi:hypothetical protein